MILDHVDGLILEVSKVRKTSAKVDRTVRTATTLARNPIRTARFVADTIRENPKKTVLHTAKHIVDIGSSAAFGVSPIDVIRNKKRVAEIKQNSITLNQTPIQSIASIAKNLVFMKNSVRPEPVMSTLSSIHDALSDGASAVISSNKSKIRDLVRLEKAESDAAAKRKADKLQAQKEQDEHDSFYDHQFHRRFQ
jgi:hypothetical protein